MHVNTYDVFRAHVQAHSKAHTHTHAYWHTGSLDSEELRRLLTTRGEILEDYEIEEFMMLAARFASDKGSRISVDELAVSLASKF